MTELKGGELKVWYIPQVGKVNAYEVLVPDLKTAVLVLDAVIGLSLFEFENRVKPDYADAAGIARYEEDGEGGLDWCDVDEYELESVAS